MEEKYNEYSDQGLMILTMLSSGSAKVWAEAGDHPCTHPVVELTPEIAEAYWPGRIGYPTGKSMKPGMVVDNAMFNPADVLQWEDDNMDDIIAAVLP